MRALGYLSLSLALVAAVAGLFAAPQFWVVLIAIVALGHVGNWLLDRGGAPWRKVLLADLVVLVVYLVVGVLRFGTGLLTSR